MNFWTKCFKMDTFPEIINSPIINFKNRSKKTAKEFERLKGINPELFDILNLLNEHTNQAFGKGIMIGEIYRTQAEQDIKWGNNPRYRKQQFKSAHQFWHAVNLCSWVFTESEIDQIIRWLNRYHHLGNYYPWLAKHYDFGDYPRIHLRYKIRS